MGCPAWRAWPVACRFGELSQQPMCPQDWHMRRCTQVPPTARQSLQPAISSGNAVTENAPEVRTRRAHPASASIKVAAA